MLSSHWPLDAILKIQFSIFFYQSVSSALIMMMPSRRWMPWDLIDDKSTLVQVMAWCRQATSHYLIQCWPRSRSPYGVIRPQGVKFAILTCYCLFKRGMNALLKLHTTVVCLFCIDVVNVFCHIMSTWNCCSRPPQLQSCPKCSSYFSGWMDGWMKTIGYDWFFSILLNYCIYFSRNTCSWLF